MQKQTEHFGEGFAIGRKAAIREWAWRKEKKETRKLFRKYYDKKRDATPERREASNARVKAWEARNQRKRKAYFKKLAKTPKRKAQAAKNSKAWRERHPEKVTEAKRQYRGQNREKCNAQALAYYHANREKINARRRALARSKNLEKRSDQRVQDSPGRDPSRYAARTPIGPIREAGAAS